ncbi:ribonuclease H2, subunit B [Xylariaceae sp. FL0804]|nr:ribonuclease H2, subunit B [Xylariaceae sp. FL0804]
MAKTRSAKGSKAAAGSSTAASSAAPTTSRYTLAPTSANPPRVFILPRRATPEARVVSLLEPRSGRPARYLVCPETGIYEFTRVAAPRSTPRSWLVQCDDDRDDDDEDDREGGHNTERPQQQQKQQQQQRRDDDDDDDAAFDTYVTKGADLFVATPIDPLFLVLPAFAAPYSAAAAAADDDDDNDARAHKRKTAAAATMFVSSDDHLDTIQAASPHLWEILQWGDGSVRRRLEARMAAVCDTAAGDNGDDDEPMMLRFSEDRLLAELLAKAGRMADGRALPPSMEERFVARPLEAPVLGVRRTASASATAAAAVVVGEESPTADPSPNPGVGEAGDSQSSTASIATATSTHSLSSASEAASTAATSVAAASGAEDESAEETAIELEQLAPALTASDEVVRLQRLRTAFRFLCARYVPPAMAAALDARLLSSSSSSSSSSVDFGPLDAYLAAVARLRREAAAASGSAGDYSRKRGLEDEEEAASRAEKRRRRDEEEKRTKVGRSRGVRDLQKVNTAGMRKMSDFFKKKT